MSRTDHHPVGSRAKLYYKIDRELRHEERRPIPPRHVAIEEQLAAMFDEDEPAKQVADIMTGDEPFTSSWLIGDHGPEALDLLYGVDEPLGWRPFATSESTTDYWDEDYQADLVEFGSTGWGVEPDPRDVELDQMVSDERIPGDWIPKLTDISFDDGYSFHVIKTPRFESAFSFMDQPKHDTCPTMRVHEIAKVCGLETDDVVRLLRLSGEYVRDGRSTVVEPVFRDFIHNYGGPVWQSLYAENARFFTEV